MAILSNGLALSSCITATKSSSGSSWNTVWMAPPSPANGMELERTEWTNLKHLGNTKKHKKTRLMSKAQDWISHIESYYIILRIYIYICIYHIYIYIPIMYDIWYMKYEIWWNMIWYMIYTYIYIYYIHSMYIPYLYSKSSHQVSSFPFAPFPLPEHCHGDGLSHLVAKAPSYGHPHQYDPRCCPQLLVRFVKKLGWYQGTWGEPQYYRFVVSRSCNSTNKY